MLAARERVAHVPIPVLVVLVGWPITVVARGSIPSLAWDESVFWNGTASGLSSLFDPYGGYIHPLARAIALGSRTAGGWELAWAGSVLVACLVAGYVASGHTSKILPREWQRFVAGVAVLVLPGTIQTLGLLGQVQWYAALFLLTWLVAGSAPRLGLAVFSVTGPFAFLLAPFVMLRRPPGWRIVLAGAGIQLAVYLTSVRGAGAEFDQLAEVLALRAVLGPMLGEFTTNGLPPVATAGLVICVATLTALAVLADTDLWPIFAGGAIIAVLGVLFAGETNDVLLVGAGARYFVGLGFGLTLFVVRNPGQPLAWAVGVLLVMATLDDLSIPVRDFFGWG